MSATIEAKKPMKTLATWSLLVVALLLAVASCSDEELTPTDPEAPVESLPTVSVSLTVRPSTMTPGMSSIVTATATIADTDHLVLFTLSISGLGGDTLIHLPTIGKGTKTYGLEVSIPHAPIVGQLDFTAFARTPYGCDSASASLTIRDDGPPTIAAVAPDTLALSKTLELEYSASDAAGIIGLSIVVQGVADRDTVISYDYTPSVSGVFEVRISESAKPGDSLGFVISALDGFNTMTVDSGVVRLADSTLPSVTYAIDTVYHAGLEDSDYGLVFFPGDTVRLRIGASDNHSLEWFGYRMLCQGDSVTTSATSDTVRFEYVIPPGTNTPEPQLWVFAADSSGNVTEQIICAVVMDGVLRPIEAINNASITMSTFDAGAHRELDADRDVLYISQFQKLHRVSLNPLTELPSIQYAYPTSFRGVDRIPGTDTLVALISDWVEHFLYWDLNIGPSNLDSISVDLPENCRPGRIQVAANGFALMEASPRTSGYGTVCPLLKVDIRTGASQVLDDAPELINFAASGDQRKIILYSDRQAAVYSSDTDSFGPVRETFGATGVTSLQHAGPSLDHTGATVLMRNRLYNSDLTDYRWLLPDPGYNTRAHALTDDGRTAYIGNWPGYWKIDVATGDVLEKVILPRVAHQLIAHDDGSRLIVSSSSWFGIVDLR